MHRTPPLLLQLLSVASLLGCSAPAPPPPAAVAAAQGPGAKCLELAGAKRERKAGEPAKVGAKHVLVKSKESKRATAEIKRSREEACLRAIEVRDKIRGGADFAEMVKEYSDESGAASRGGSIGTVERAEVAPPFADAAFELGLNELSDVVETDFGFHVIMRTE